MSCHIMSLSFYTVYPFLHFNIFISFLLIPTNSSLHPLYHSFEICLLLPSFFHSFLPFFISFFPSFLPSFLPFLIPLSSIYLFIHSFILFVLLFFLHHFPLQLKCNNTLSSFCKAVELFTILFFDTIKQLI